MTKDNLKVLLVEDDEDDYIITCDLLREVTQPSFTLEWVKTYKDGLEKMCAPEYDIALVDYRLGQENGIELIEEIHKSGCDVPVILLTGQGDWETDLQAMKAGAVDYLIKGSFDASLLERSIRYAVERKKSELKVKKLNESLEKRVVERTKQLEDINVELKKEVLERKKAEESALQERNLIEGLMDSTVEGIFGLNCDCECTFINTAASTMLGYTAEEVLGKDMHQLIQYKYPDGSPYPIDESPMAKVCKEGKVLPQIEEMLWRKDGTSFPVLFSCSPLINKNKIKGAVVSITDISERKANEEKIYNLAYHDPLTSLPNKLLLRERLNQAIIKAKKKKQYVGVMFLDLDRFKNINDSLGHKVGDILLKSVAERLLTCVREFDTVARQGGDEFILVIPELKHVEDIEIVADKILGVLSKSFIVDDQEIFITPSIGIALYPNDSDNGDILIKYADVAMYHSKRTGRNTFRYFTPEMDTEVMEKLNTEVGLRKALQNHEFALFYQPKFDLYTNKIVSLEALIRWYHPLVGIIPPDKFIPAAEEIGIIERLNEWILDTACKTIKEFQKNNVEVSIAVNISPGQVDKELVSLVKSTLETNEVNPRLLEIELIETDIMYHDSLLSPILKDLKELGLSISIDDFGTGYSSLARLRELAVDYLKIDKSFITDFPDNVDSVAIIKAIIGIAKSLKLKVIAEGVETEEQLKLLRKYKCDLIQGYYISKPLPKEEILQLLTNKDSEKKEGYFPKNRFKIFKF